MVLTSEITIPVLLFLLILLVLLCILHLMNRLALWRVHQQEVIVEADLHQVLEYFCMEEGVHAPRIVPSNAFWYRPISNTIGVKNLDSRNVADSLAFAHELFHFQDRRRVLNIQVAVSLYTYLVSTGLKLFALVGIWLGTPYSGFRLLLLVDVFMLILYMILTFIIERHASKKAVSFLDRHQLLPNKNIAIHLSNRALFSYLLQFLIYAIISFMLFMMLRSF